MYILWHFIIISLRNLFCWPVKVSVTGRMLMEIQEKHSFHRHEQSERHKESVEKAYVLMLNTENNKSIEEKLYSVFKERLEKNKKILLSNLNVILR